MKRIKSFLSVTLLLAIATDSCSQKPSPGNSSIVGHYVASTPCTQGTRPLPGIQSASDCELMKWNLTLYQDELKKTPTTFKLHCTYGLPKQGTTGFIGGGNVIDIEGMWTIGNGMASDPAAVVYHLNDSKTNKTISFLKLNDNLLHLLDNDRHLMIGSAAWSYTLNRTDNR